jgi:hypothetical protein
MALFRSETKIPKSNGHARPRQPESSWPTPSRLEYPGFEQREEKSKERAEGVRPSFLAEVWENSFEVRKGANA